MSVLLISIIQHTHTHAEYKRCDNYIYGCKYLYYSILYVGGH